MERLAQRGRHVRADPGRIARDQRQHHDGRHVGQHAQELAGHLHARGLQVELQHRHAAEQVGTKQHPCRAPGGEGGERQRNPAAAGHHALHPERRIDRGDVGPRKAAQRAAGHHRREADAPHRVAQRVGRFGRFAHRAQHQPRARAVEEPGEARGERHRAVHQRMLAEQRRAHQRQVAQHRQRVLRQRGQLGLHVLDAGESREARAEQAERQARRVLVGVEPDHQHAEHGGEQRPGAHAGREARPGAAGVHGGGEASDGRAEHDALCAQVDDARLLVDEQPERGERQHGAGAERGAQQQCVGFHHAAPFRAGAPTQRTR